MYIGLKLSFDHLCFVFCFFVGGFSSLFKNYSFFAGQKNAEDEMRDVTESRSGLEHRIRKVWRIGLHKYGIFKLNAFLRKY